MNTMRKNVIITTSWDDGHALDMKLARLLSNYKVPATFYIPSKSSKQKIISPVQIRKLFKSFEIGSHTYNHTDITRVSVVDARSEILKGKKHIENIVGRKVSMFSYPFGAYNKKMQFILKNLGFHGGRTTKIFSTKYIDNAYVIATTIHAANHPFSYYVRQALSGNVSLFLHLWTKKTLDDWEYMSVESLRFVLKHGGVWHLWGHSWEIEKNNDWDKLERIFKKIRTVRGQYSNVRLMTNSQLFQNNDTIYSL